MLVMKDIRYARQSVKVLRKVDARTRARLLARIEQIAASTAPDVKDLGDGLFRMHVGEWRIIYSDDRTILVIKIGARGDVYKH